MTVAGCAARGSHTLPVEDPATATVFAHAPAASEADVDRAVGAAGDAAADWAGQPYSLRAKALRACGAAVGAHVDELARLLTREQGKPLADAMGEVRLAADWFGHTADLVLGPETLVDGEARTITMDRTPYGPVAAIAPSNYPVILAVTKVAPALLAGNTVVLKPSEVTPLTTLRIGELLRDVLPAGVLNVISGVASTGWALVNHPGTGVVSFTGSVLVGERIAQAAAASFKHLVLELGGNDACIVLPGADIAEIAAEIFSRAMINSGQFCAAIKRVYVAAEQHDELAAALAAQTAAARMGAGTDRAVRYGPLATRGQLAAVTEMVAEAERAGARVRSGLRPELPGHFFPPTVVTDLPPGTRLEGEEQFGPVIPVIAYRAVAEAVARANGTRFGLGGSVWGEPASAARIAAELECGTAWVNTHGDLHPHAPFGGFRSSGLGVEYGYWGLLEYSRIKVLHVRHADNRRP